MEWNEEEMREEKRREEKTHSNNNKSFQISRNKYDFVQD